jgi:speckle-type POZ protein
MFGFARGYNWGSFTCLGRKWDLRIDADDDEDTDEGMVSVSLQNTSKKIIDIEASVIVKACREIKIGPSTFAQKYKFYPGKIWTILNFASHSTIMDSLVDGTLVIEVQMNLADPSKTPPPFVPENPSACKVIQGLFMDEESADVVFELGGGQQLNGNSRKKAKNSSVRFFAHRLILQRCSPTLAELCGSAGDETTTIQISDVAPDIFRHLLHYIYGGEIADDGMNSHAQKIIDVADKYGVVNLKLEAEARLVKSTHFRVGNLLDLLLYADSKNCALLKEAAMDYMVEHKSEVMKGISFDGAPGALVGDVLAAMSRGERRNGTREEEEDGSEFDAMRISELRWRAHENGFGVDGSREMLIAALEGGSNEDS